MTIEELIIYGKKYLSSINVKILLSCVTGYDTLDLYNHLDEKITEKKIDLFKKYINMVLNKYPVQYITKNVNFYGFDYYVDERVLIPRFDTEQLIYYISKYIKKYFSGQAKLIDLGCGSGVIGITLSKLFPYLDVTCLDISDDALKVTQINASNLNANIKITKGDMLKGVNEKYDIIVSNPPYISMTEQIDDIVKYNEPKIALYGGQDGLLFYRNILCDIKKNINNKFIIAFEIGYQQKKSIEKICNHYLNNVKIECYKDLGGRDRVLIITNIME
ncbi:MAG: peptide chain release factor N(5)-glutamine methyltransferase [bacterium]|nr:peptide chain release factor N(5)-glutamine methyltransferase [bacterium]